MLTGMKTSWRDNRAAGATLSAAAYVAALAVAIVVVRATGLPGALAQLGLGTLVATVFIFATSVALDNSSMYDPYWSLQPLAIAGYYLWTHWGSLSGRQILIAVLAFLYAARLTANFYRDWPGLSKEDFRYFGKCSSLFERGGSNTFPARRRELGTSRKLHRVSALV